VTSNRAVLIVNTRSRRGREWYGLAQTLLREHGLEVEAAFAFKTFEPLVAEVAEAIARKAPVVVVGGGDGTFSAIARLFVNTDSVLGVLPLGTGNQFARDLAVPADLEVACRIIAEGRVAEIDLGCAGDFHFLNVATIGLTTLIARELTAEGKRRFGRLIYAAALYEAIRKIAPFRVELETDNGKSEFETLQVVIGNGRYHAGPFQISPTASITGHRLSLYALQTTDKKAILRLGLYMAFGGHVQLPEVYHEETTQGFIRTYPPLPATVDGEICARTPMRFNVVPHALKVLVGESFVV
jgi:diacylglycerol kinase (ATP)